MAATLLSDTIRKQVGEKKLVGAVFMDLTRAFDTVNHGRLIDKLHMHGINGREFDWFTDFLFHRTQFVDINGTHSNDVRSSSRYDTGTIAFFILLNDFAETLRHSEVIQYADDTVCNFCGRK